MTRLFMLLLPEGQLGEECGMLCCEDDGTFHGFAQAHDIGVEMGPRGNYADDGTTLDFMGEAMAVPMAQPITEVPRLEPWLAKATQKAPGKWEGTYIFRGAQYPFKLILVNP
ncbi:hypothetical protein [Desulfovibrio cuneatus]|uniref:hypothetical protein n=1 Tax=Desulfovibrio cuneatus TaxID=159728 RepID=UPI000488BD47|nr:hypothetical protein [Desulfovibrio cuneatus]